MYYKSVKIFYLNDIQVTYYPCPGVLYDTSSQYNHFSIHKILYEERQFYCDNCKRKIRLLKRNRKRVITPPSRKRQYTSMPSNDKAQAYGECGRDIKKIKRQYSRLIGRLEGKNRLL